MAARVSRSRSALRDGLRGAVLERILSGELTAGGRINESRLAQELGVSRTPLREALLGLQAEGFVSSETSRGFFVAPLSAREVREVYPMLWTLEGLAVRLSGPLAASWVPELERINRELAESAGPEEALASDTTFHRKLISGCPNRRLLKTVGELRLVIRRYAHLHMQDETLVMNSIHQHREIISALRDGDVNGAIEWLEKNTRFGMDVSLVRLGEP